MNFNRFHSLSLALIMGLAQGCHVDYSNETTWSLTSPGGVLVGLPPAGTGHWVLQGRQDREWLVLAEVERGYDPVPVPWWLNDIVAFDELRWRKSGGSILRIVGRDEPVLVLETKGLDVLNSDEVLEARLKITMEQLPLMAVRVHRLSESRWASEEGWLKFGCRDGDSVEECFDPEPSTWAETSVNRRLSIPDWEQASRWPSREEVTVEAVTSAMSEEGRVSVVVDSQTRQYWSTGRRLVWGDPHAQSNLSWDGCEVESEECASRYGAAASDFFEQARLGGLDFAALTESSETQSYYPNGLLAKQYDVWEAQIEAVNRAKRSDFVPLLGYEWSPHDLLRATVEAPWNSGAKVILFGSDQVCEEYRLAAQRAQTNFTKGFALYSPTEGDVANSTIALYEALDQAAGRCGFRSLVGFAVHGTKAPNTDWRQEENRENPQQETLFELYSERGAFECQNASDPSCLIEGEDALEGSFQAALSAGRRFGVAASTDAHDGRPGSVDDGPSSRWLFSENLAQQQAVAGGLTGVWIASSLEAEAIIDGMQRRLTVATTGPKVPMRLLAVGADDLPYLPGDVVPDEGWPIAVRLELLEGWAEEATLEWVSPSGAAMAAVVQPGGWHVLEQPEGGAVYGRVGLLGGAHTLWLSPFFGDL